MSFRGNLTPVANKGIGGFAISKRCNLKGNVMSMLFGDAGKDNYSLSGKSYAFNKLFINCDALKSVSANFLPATTLGRSCYEQMFDGCTSLTSAPELPATILVRECYFGMFRGCNRLNYIKMLAIDTSADDCLISWIYDVASSGTFVKNPEAT